MLNWFKRLFHLHDWVILEKRDLEITDSRDRVECRGSRFIMQCKTCGCITKRDMI